MKTSESKAVCRNEIARVVDYILRKATLNQGPTKSTTKVNLSFSEFYSVALVTALSIPKRLHLFFHK